MHDGQQQPMPPRRAWSGSNDFTIRRWDVVMWRSGEAAPQMQRRGALTVEVGGWNVGITRGRPMRGHKNGVRVLLPLGPTLWSGGDDGTIRIWRCADGRCVEVVEDAHRGSVLRLAVVRSFVWSAGVDGLIKEWTIGGQSRQCVRQLSPEGAEKGIYGLVPLGHDVWVCGHHPSIQVLSQASLSKTSEHWAHDPWISNLLAVDRVETRVVWSTSLSDKKLKIWRHTIRGFQPSVEELQAASRLFEEEERVHDQRISAYVDRNAILEEDIQCSTEEFEQQLERLSEDLAKAREEAEAAETKRQEAEGELEALRAALEVEGFGPLLTDPEGLRARLRRAAALEGALATTGICNLLEDPQELRKAIAQLCALRDAPSAADSGVVASTDETQLKEALALQASIRAACARHGLDDLSSPRALEEFLRGYASLRDAFRQTGQEGLLNDLAALRRCLGTAAPRSEHQPPQLSEALERLAWLEDLSKKMAEKNAALSEEVERAEPLRQRLAAYEELGDLDFLRSCHNRATEVRSFDLELEKMRRALEEKERERQEALERERIMAIKYKELDIFKLDVIARELKSLDGDLTTVGKSARSLICEAGKLKNYDEQQQIGSICADVLDRYVRLRSHIRDVIKQCLSETQKMHIGISVDDRVAAGELHDGGVMVGYVCQEVDVPDFGRSKAAKLRQEDELQRERRLRASRPDMHVTPELLPRSPSSPQLGVGGEMRERRPPLGSDVRASPHCPAPRSPSLPRLQDTRGALSAGLPPRLGGWPPRIPSPDLSGGWPSGG